LTALAEATSVRLGLDHDTSPPSWSKPVKEREHERQFRDHDVNTNEVELFFPVGRRQGVRPGDLVGALAGDTDIPGSLVGRITILDNKSFVGLPRRAAEHVLDGFKFIQIRGNEVPVTMAR